MKICIKCGEEKPLSEFHRHKNRPGGHRSDCKDCRRLYRQKKYHENPEKIKLAGLKWRRANPDKAAAQTKRYPEKYKARKVLNHVIEKGRISKPKTCSVCGKTGRVEGHHEDYSKPLEVIWLCSQCHIDIHTNKKTDSHQTTSGGSSAE